MLSKFILVIEFFSSLEVLRWQNFEAIISITMQYFHVFIQIILQNCHLDLRNLYNKTCFDSLEITIGNMIGRSYAFYQDITTNLLLCNCASYFK